MIDYKPFIEILFDTDKIRRETHWRERWEKAQKMSDMVVDDADKDFRQQLQAHFFENGTYEFQEYWTGRKYLAQLSDSVGLEPSEDETNIDKIFEVKGKNFDKIKPLTERLKELEKVIWIENETLKNATLAGKAESIYHAGPLERRIKKEKH
jgi:hypothetical protein